MLLTHSNNMPNPVNDIAIVSGQLNANVSGSFSTSISGNVINVNTSISGNTLTVNQTQTVFGEPIILAGNIALNMGLNQLQDLPVSSGVAFKGYIGQTNTVWFGGISGNTPYFSGVTDHNGINMDAKQFYEITNLNQLNIFSESSGTSISYFAIHISGGLVMH